LLNTITTITHAINLNNVCVGTDDFVDYSLLLLLLMLFLIKAKRNIKINKITSTALTHSLLTTGHSLINVRSTATKCSDDDDGDDAATHHWENFKNEITTTSESQASA